MRIERKGTVVLVGLMLTGIAIWGWSTVTRGTSTFTQLESSSGYRLVSVQEMGEICLPAEPGTGDANADTNLFASSNQSDDNRLLDLLRGMPVYAASQENSQTL